MFFLDPSALIQMLSPALLLYISYKSLTSGLQKTQLKTPTVLSLGLFCFIKQNNMGLLGLTTIQLKYTQLLALATSTAFEPLAVTLIYIYTTAIVTAHWSNIPVTSLFYLELATITSFTLLLLFNKLSKGILRLLTYTLIVSALTFAPAVTYYYYNLLKSPLQGSLFPLMLTLKTGSPLFVTWLPNLYNLVSVKQLLQYITLIFPVTTSLIFTLLTSWSFGGSYGWVLPLLPGLIMFLTTPLLSQGRLLLKNVLTLSSVLNYAFVLLLALCFLMIFVKAMKSLALSFFMMPIAGCAIGTGIIFASYLRSIAYNPDMEDALFQSAIVGFALVETFMVIVVTFALFMFFMV